MKNKTILLFSIFALAFNSCKKLLENTPPPDVVTDASVFSEDNLAISVINGIYTKWSNEGIYGGQNLSMIPGLSADELSLWSGKTEDLNVLALYRNSLTVQFNGYDYWNLYYPYIYVANSCIERIPVSEGLSDHVKKQLHGEALFLRAFCYYYLQNMYGDVPLVTSTDYTKTASLPRTSTDSVYQQIITDLTEATTLLSPHFIGGLLKDSSDERYRPTQAAAYALLARAYLFSGDFRKAEEAATKVIENTKLFGLVPLNDVFLSHSREAIWQLQHLPDGWGATRMSDFIIPPTGFSNWNYFYMSDFLLGAFENGDQRRVNWVGDYNTTVNGAPKTYRYSHKYKSNNFNGPTANIESSTLLRLAEQYLIRAEARAEQDNLVGAEEDLFVVRDRAGLGHVTVTTKQKMLDDILHERQVEYFCEWGHRWFDLKRTGKVDEVMSEVTPAKGGSKWEPHQKYYPISRNVITADPFIEQTDGY